MSMPVSNPMRLRGTLNVDAGVRRSLHRSPEPTRVAPVAASMTSVHVVAAHAGPATLSAIAIPIALTHERRVRIIDYLKLTTVPSGLATIAVLRVPRTVSRYSTLVPRVTFNPLT